MKIFSDFLSKFFGILIATSLPSFLLALNTLPKPPSPMKADSVYKPLILGVKTYLII